MRLRFALTRIAQFPLVLAVIYLLTFFLAWVVPGSPFERTEKKPDKLVLKAMEERIHASNTAEFLAYYPGQLLLHGDFGQSLQADWTVNEIIGDSLPISVTLGLFAMALATVAGVTVGTLAAVRRGGPLDWSSLGLALVGISLPASSWPRCC